MLLPFDWILLVFEEGSRGVYLDHRASFEVLGLFLRSIPLREEIVGGHIIAHVVEVAAKGAAGLPPPSTAAGSENYRRGLAWRAVGHSLGSDIDGRGLAGVPRLSASYRFCGVLWRLNQMMNLDGG